MGQPNWLLGRNLKIKIKIVKELKSASNNMKCLYKMLQIELMKIEKKKIVITIKYSAARQKTKIQSI